MQDDSAIKIWSQKYVQEKGKSNKKIERKKQEKMKKKTENRREK